MPAAGAKTDRHACVADRVASERNHLLISHFVSMTAQRDGTVEREFELDSRGSHLICNSVSTKSSIFDFAFSR
jgi:hypothetical protein